MAKLLISYGATEVGCPKCIGNAEMVNFLDEAGLLPCVLGVNGSQIFSDAIGPSRITLLRCLMHHDGHINFNQAPAASEASSESQMPLDKAIVLGDLMLIEYLISRGAEPGSRTLTYLEPEDMQRKESDIGGALALESRKSGLLRCIANSSQCCRLGIWLPWESTYSGDMEKKHPPGR